MSYDIIIYVCNLIYDARMCVFRGGTKIKQISQRWILGPELCDMWTSSDVLCCTASILHLVAIATDR